FFFFSSRRRHTRSYGDWSSDVCSSDLTTFTYANVRVAPARICPQERTTVSVDVTNTGTRAGDEVAQLYIRDVVSTATRPVKQLRSEERRVGKEGNSRGTEDDEERKK